MRETRGSAAVATGTRSLRRHGHSFHLGSRAALGASGPGELGQNLFSSVIDTVPQIAAEDEPLVPLVGEDEARDPSKRRFL